MDSINQKSVAAIADLVAGATPANIQVKKLPIAQSPTQFTIAHFDELPDCGYVRLPVVLALFGCSRPTWYRWIKSGRVPTPKKAGSRISLYQVGSLRVSLKNFEVSGQLGSKVGN